MRIINIQYSEFLATYNSAQLGCLILPATASYNSLMFNITLNDTVKTFGKGYFPAEIVQDAFTSFTFTPIHNYVYEDNIFTVSFVPPASISSGFLYFEI